MSELGQCVAILNLTSSDWKESRRAVVAHSFRVMSRARNYDEMVVGIMHHIYASSDYARGLFACDVYHNSIWKEALDLFVEKRKRLTAKGSGDLPEEVLLGLNMDQNLKTEKGKVEEWMAEECKWSSKYKNKLERIGANRIARNVMIYDLEDKLEILIHPERFAEEKTWEIALPWKKELMVGVYTSRHSVSGVRIPDTDDNILLRPLKSSERADLVDKYLRGISLLMRMECCDGPREEDFSKERLLELPQMCKAWYGDWLAEDIYDDADDDVNDDDENNDERLFC